jgi:Tol biopolymer transport system component
MPIEGGQMQQLTFLDSYNAGPAWSPDGKEIAYGSTQDGKPKVWRVNANGGTPRPFGNSEISLDGFALTWSPQSEILYERPGNQNFHFLDPQTEEERPLVANDSLGWMFYPRYSPDGKSVAVRWNRSGGSGLWLISLEDTSQILLLRSEGIRPIEWSIDGKWIYAWDCLKKPIEVLMVPAARGNPLTFVKLPFEQIDYEDGISMTPDGKCMVCAVQEIQSDIWVMENFDPEAGK